PHAGPIRLGANAPCVVDAMSPADRSRLESRRLTPTRRGGFCHGEPSRASSACQRIDPLGSLSRAARVSTMNAWRGPRRLDGAARGYGDESRVNMMIRARWRRTVIFLTAGAAAFGVASGVYAAIPDSSGVVHGCYAKLNGTLRVIDGAKNQKCS